MKTFRIFTAAFLLMTFTLSCSVRKTDPGANPSKSAAAVALSSAVPATSPAQTNAAKEETAPEPQETAPEPQESQLTGEKKITQIKALPAGSEADVSLLSDAEVMQCFFYEPIPDAVFARMEGKTFNEKCTTKRSDLRYVKVLHTGFDGKTLTGELVVHKKIAQDITEIFFALYKAAYPIEKMRLADDYNADDDASMADNNTSAFNFRVVEGTKTLSKHAYGLAIDINPLYNPYIIIKNGKKKVEPPEAMPYTDRKLSCPYYIKKGDLCWKLFKEHGFSWGGSWRPAQDYQHFYIK